MKRIAWLFAAMLLCLAPAFAQHYVVLTWTPTAAAPTVTYNVYRGTSHDGEWKKPLVTGIAKGCTGATCTYTDSSSAVVGGARLFYRITTVYETLESYRSNEAKVTVPAKSVSRTDRLDYLLAGLR